jgi:hypothetical protein
MFLVSDRIERRHQRIESFLRTEPIIAILLAAVDFEWTMRRAVIALGTSTSREIRDVVLKRCTGASRYKDAWNAEVAIRLGKSLPHVVPNWPFIVSDAYTLRNQVAHGLVGLPSRKRAVVCVEAFLSGSVAIVAFAKEHEEELFGTRLRVRRKSRRISKL